MVADQTSERLRVAERHMEERAAEKGEQQPSGLSREEREDGVRENEAEHRRAGDESNAVPTAARAEATLREPYDRRAVRDTVKDDAPAEASVVVVRRIDRKRCTVERGMDGEAQEAQEQRSRHAGLRVVWLFGSEPPACSVGAEEALEDARQQDSCRDCDEAEGTRELPRLRRDLERHEGQEQEGYTQIDGCEEPRVTRALRNEERAEPKRDNTGDEQGHEGQDTSLEPLAPQRNSVASRGKPLGYFRGLRPRGTVGSVLINREPARANPRSIRHPRHLRRSR